MRNDELHKLALETARSFIQKRVNPIASELDRSGEFPLENMREMGRLGLLGLPYPESLGGGGLGYETYVNFVREVAHHCASTAMTIVAHTGLTSHPIYAFGSQVQKEKFLQPLLAGEKIGAFCLTEPQSGSDISAMQTTAQEHHDTFILKGNKIFITNAHVADIYVVAAKTAPEKGMLGISLFILEKGMPGFIIPDKKEPKLGMCASDTGELVFDGVEVPAANLIGTKNKGFQYLHETLTNARLGMAAIALGIAEGAQGYCLEYVKQRKQFGKQLYHFESIKNMLADMETHISASELLLMKAAGLKDGGSNISKEASMAKLFASETAMQTTRDAIQILGANGYSKEYPLERFFRDAKITEIGDGTSEIQRIIIADELIKRKNKIHGA